MQFSFVGLVLLSNVAMAAQERTLGNVVAVERNFGTPSFEQCKASFEVAVSGIEYGCTVAVLTVSAYEQMISSTRRFAYQNPCTVELLSTLDGYRIKVSKVSLAGPDISESDALKCMKGAFASGDWGSKELTTTVFTVR